MEELHFAQILSKRKCDVGIMLGSALQWSESGPLHAIKYERLKEMLTNNLLLFEWTAEVVNITLQPPHRVFQNYGSKLASSAY